MSFSVSTQSLSALVPVKFTYKYNKEEKLSGTYNLYRNGLGYYQYDVFKGFHDAALSNKNCLILTENKPLKDVFESDSRQIDIGTVAGCLYLKASTGQYVTTLSDDIFVGGTGENLLINVMPVTNKIVELKVGKTKYIQVDKEYPYTARLSTEILDGEDLARQQFELEYKDGLISFKTITQEGGRYLSYGADLTVRAVGLMLNETIVNSYVFKTEFVSNNGIYYDFDAKVSEVKYFNEIAATANRNTVNIKEDQESSTNLLITCTTADIAKSNEAVVNIALTKTNFSSSGSYTTKQTI